MHRSHGDLEADWIRQRGEQEELTLQALVSELFKKSDFDLKKTSELKSLPGALASGAVELQRITAKALNARRASRQLYVDGAAGWSSVDAYHASFLTASLILAIYGVFKVSIEGANFFLDLRPQDGDTQHKKQFAVESRGIAHPVRFMTIGGAPLEHRHVWEMLSRLGNKCSFEPLDNAEQFWLKNFDFERYQSTRNKIIYQAHYWPDTGDLHIASVVSGPIADHALFQTYTNNLWMEDELKDHFLMEILSSLAAKIDPFR